MERRGRVLFGIQLCNCLYEFRKTTINQCQDNRCETVGFRRGVLRPLFWDFRGRGLVVDDQRFGTGCRSHLRLKQMGHIPCPKRRRATMRIIK